MDSSERQRQHGLPDHRPGAIRDVRRAKRLSISELGRLTGISKGYLSQLESGRKTHPSLEKLAAIADVLEVPLSDLLQAPDEPADSRRAQAALRELAVDRSLDPSDIDMLTSIRFAGPPPRTRARWEYIWTAIHTSELLDNQSDIARGSQVLTAREAWLGDLAAAGVPSTADLLAPSLDESRPDWPRAIAVPRDKWTDRDRPLADFWPTELDECLHDGRYLRLSRRAVFDIATACRGSADGALRLLVATYAWSAGNRDHRAIARANRILDCSSPDEVGRKLFEAIEELADRGPLAAYRLLAGEEGGAHAIRGLGPAIFTKILYFAGGVEAERSAGPLRPLILDHRVAAAVAHGIAGEHLVAASPRSYPWPAHWYELYLELAHQWAEKLATTPDVVEWMLWNRGDGAAQSRLATGPRSHGRAVEQSGTERRSWADQQIGNEEPAEGPTSEAPKKTWLAWDIKQLSSQPQSPRDQQAAVQQGSRE